jgi:hypothetical protein
MALLTPFTPSATGTVVTTTAAAVAGDTFAPGDHTFLNVTNLSGGAITVTFDSVALSNYGTDEDTGGSVANGATRSFGPFPANRFANTTTGLVSVTYSAVTSVVVILYAT